MFTNIFNYINPKEVLTNLPDAVFVVDSDGRVVWVNDKASVIFEMKKSNLKGLFFNELVANGLELAAKSFSRRNSVVTGAFSVDGKEFFVEMNAKKFIDQYFITIRDITAMTNVLAKAEKTGRLNKEKNIMFLKLANEIKSPIQSVIGFSQALLDGLGGEINDKQNKYVRIINKNSTELLYFMERFFEFSQAESSLFEFKKLSFDITNILRLLVKLNENGINSKRLTVNFEFEDLTKKLINSDEACIKTALQNIIDTIIKTVDKGSLTIKADNPSLADIENYDVKIPPDADENSYIRITFTDTGMGYTQNELDGIFEPYTQLDSSNKKAITRSIALGTAYLIIRRLGGTLKLESEVMKGSEYTVILPVDKEI